MARSRGLPIVLALLVVSACTTPATPTVPPIPNEPTPLPTTGAASPMPVGGGCSGTQVYAGPGPDADLGLATNPWAAANPASSGLVAYFWHAPPGVVVANVPNGGDKILWVTHGAAAPTLVIDAHPAGSNAPIVHVVASAASSPLDNYPSNVPIPTPGCWQLDLTLGSVKASLAIDVGAADAWAPLETALRLPAPLTGPCPRATGRTVSSAFGAVVGDGPVFPVGLGTAGVLSVEAGPRGYAGKVLWVASAAYRGPVLIRGARIDGAGSITFSVVGPGATPVDELRLEDALATSDGEPPGWREWPSEADVTSPGCYEFQVDGTGFTDDIVFEARA